MNFNVDVLQIEGPVVGYFFRHQLVQSFRELLVPNWVIGTWRYLGSCDLFAKQLCNAYAVDTRRDFQGICFRTRCEASIDNFQFYHNLVVALIKSKEI